MHCFLESLFSHSFYISLSLSILEVNCPWIQLVYLRFLSVLGSWDLYISSYITWCGFYPHQERNTEKQGWIMLCISSSRGNVTYSPVMLVPNIVTSFVVMEVVQRIRPLEVWFLNWHYTFWWKQSGVNQEENKRKKNPIWV